ncbi:hypothetical protein K4F52_004124 [Lecanicillium sp. MT-2017a]|nr:hypothetical protein K4F52_004124 [Lecanicillium sp. MT-2017a]
MDQSYEVLITGSSGHLGTALMLALPELGFKPFGIDLLPSATSSAVGSINDREFLSSLLQNSAIRHVVHTATLHKPHVDSHTKEQFIETNITGTLVLLEEVAKLGTQIESFLFLSTTSAFGMALSPPPGSPAAWIDETTVPQPKNIYGVTKSTAEDICFLLQRQTGLPILVLRLSRFFPEEDDEEDRRNAVNKDNLKVLELSHRRCDIEDIVSAIVCAMRKAKEVRWAKYIISAPPPFPNDTATLCALENDPRSVFESVVPDIKTIFATKGWGYLSRIDRVYDSTKAIQELGWQPKYTFARVAARISNGEEWRSDLTLKVGEKGYHTVSTGVYTSR